MLEQQKITNEQITSFFNLCKNHDWYYRMSDDSSYFNKGDSERNYLLNESKSSDIFRKIYTDYCNYIFSNSPKPLLEHYLN